MVPAIEHLVARGTGGLLRRFPYALVEGTLIALLAVQGARIFWTAVEPLGPFGHASGGTARDTDTQILTHFDPFFRLSGQSGTAVVTSLPVKLFGVRMDEATGRGSAIIATPDGVQSSFAVGDAIMPGITLKSVARDNVTIERGGVAEQLYLDQSVPAAVAKPTTPPLPSANVPTTTTAVALRTDIAFAPHLEKGVLTGLVVTPGGSGAAFRALGLQPGDVLTQINGQGFRSADDAARVLAALPASGPVTFGVERAGKPVTLTARVAP